MPIGLVNPSVGADGSLPASPIGSAFGNAVAALGQNIPNAMDKARMGLEQAQTQQIQQQTQGAGAMGQIFQSALQSASSPVPVDPANPQAGTRAPTQAELQTRMLPAVADAASRAGHPELIAPLARTVAGYMPGAKPEDMTMPELAAGQSYAETPSMYVGGNTPAARDRAAKIQNIVQTQGVDDNTAAGIVDGVTELTTDQNGQRVLVNKATGANRLIYSPQPNTINGGSPMGAPGAAPTGAPSAAPAAPAQPAPGGVGPTPINNPFNLRPVGSSTGFMQFKDPQTGFMAGLDDLNLKLSGKSQAMNGQTPTLRTIISTYSPPNENNTAQLIQQAAQRMNITPDTPLNPSQLIPLVKAIGIQEGAFAGGGNPGAGAPAPATPAATGRFTMNPGELGVKFDNIYGGSAVMNRGQHMISSLTGGQEQDPALADMSKLNNLKLGLTNAMALMPGRSANTNMMNQLLESVPDTTSDVASDKGDTAFEQARINPADAESKFNQLINQAALIRHEAATAPYLDPKLRDTYMTAVHSIDTTLENALPPQVYARYAQANGLAAPQIPDASTLVQGNAVVNNKGGTVKMVAPDGKTTGNAKAEDVPRLLKLGYKAGG